MPAPASCITYGSAGILYTSVKIKERGDGWDVGSFQAISPARDSFSVDGPVPGYAGMYVAEHEPEQAGPNWLHTVQGIGLYGSHIRRIKRSATSSEDSFDTGAESWIYPAQSSPLYGQSHSEHPNLRAIQISDEDGPVSAWKIVNLDFKGLKNGSRPVRRKVDTLTREATRKNFIVTLPGGDIDFEHNWNLLLATPTLQLSWISLTRPDSSLVGSQGSGSDAADFPAWYHFDFVAPDDSLTWNWPNGVVLAAISWDEIPGTTICFITAIYVQRDRVSLA